MVAEAPNRPTPGLVAPDWLRRQQEQRPASNNVNINDIYWRKPVQPGDTAGYIVVGPSAIPGPDGRPLTVQAEARVRKGWEPLIAYSYTNRVSSKTQQRETIESTQDRLATPDWAYWLFVNGGAHLFPIEQIVEHHWHLQPPYYPAGTPAEDVFPQLADWEVPGAFWCPACPGSAPPKNSEEQVSTHLILQHSMTSVQVNDLYEQTAGFTNPAHTSGGIRLRRKLVETEMRAEQQRNAPSPELQARPSVQICNNCGERISGLLRDHECAINLNPDASAPQLEHAPLTSDEVAQASATTPAPDGEAAAPSPAAASEMPLSHPRPRPRAPQD